MKINNTIDIDEINKKIKEKDISIVEIAEKTGYSRMSVWRYLNKKREPKIGFINKLIKIL